MIGTVRSNFLLPLAFALIGVLVVNVGIDWLFSGKSVFGIVIGIIFIILGIILVLMAVYAFGTRPFKKTEK